MDHHILLDDDWWLFIKEAVMHRKKRLVVLWDDHTNANIEEIYGHIDSWKEKTADIISRIEGYKKDIATQKVPLTHPDCVVAYLNHYHSAFSRCLDEFQSVR